MICPKCKGEAVPHWISQHAYQRYCVGCGKRTKDCTCEKAVDKQ